MKKLTFLILSLLGIVLAQNKPNTIALRPIQTDTDSVFVINSSKDLYYIKVKTNTGSILGSVVLSMSPTTGDLSLTIGGATYVANLGTQNDFESATYSSATGEITLTANDGTNTVLTIDGSETKLTGGAGINITGNGTSATPYDIEALDVSPTNELQTLGLSGQVLSLSGANSLTLPNTSPVLVASNDLMITGGNLQTGAPLVQNTETVQNGFTRSFTGGNFGLGTNTPQNTLEVNSTVTDSSGLRFTQVNKYTPKSTGENAYLAVNSLGNVVVGEQIDLCNLAQSIPSSTYAVGSEALFLGTTSIPSGWVGYEFDYASLFASCTFSANIADFYFGDFQHCGQSTPPAPISVLNAAAVQSFIDNTLIPDLIGCGITVSVGDIIYTVSGSTIVVYYNPAYNPTNNNFVFGDVSNPLCEKQSPSIPTALPTPSGGSCYKAQLPTLAQSVARLNARAYAAPDSALFWNGDSLYLDNFANLVTSLQGGTFNTIGTSTPSQNVADDVYHTGKVAIGNTTTGVAKFRVGSNNFLAANTPYATAWISDNGGRLYIGDNGAADGVTAHNVSIGEFGGSDTDILQLHGKNGVNITGNGGGSGADIVNVRVATNGNVGIGTTTPANKLHIGSAFVPNTGGIRLPITSASPVQTGQAIGVDANGDIVVVAASVGGGGITSLGGQTGAAQTLSVTNTTAAQGWTSAADNHSLNLRAWDLNGNAGTSASTNFVGTTDAVDLVFRTNNLEKLRITQAGRLLLSNTGGSNLNTFLGQNTGNESNSGGNVGVGANALQLVSTGIVNTAMGVDALKSLTTGTRNAAFGYLAGSMLQTGSFNTALGMNAMLNSVSASNTIGIGFQSFNNFNGSNSIAIGQSAGSMQTSGTNNIFIGSNATTGNVSNTASNQLNLNSWIYGDNGKIGLNGKLIPESNLVVNGSFATAVQTVNASGTIGATASTILVNNAATGVTLTLPNAALFPARIIVIGRVDNTSTGAVTINSAGGQVQALNRTMGATTTLSTAASGDGVATFQSNGTNWYRIGR